MRLRNVLLVGNGPSRSTGDRSWASLLNDVAQSVNGTAVSEGDYKTKPFPILYEQLLLEARKNKGWSEFKLKKNIAAQVQSIRTRDVHRAIMDLPFHETLTTNYDHALEEASKFAGRNRSTSGYVEERRYSLFRHVKLRANRRLWYIHGDCREPSSILLGYEQYSGFLQQMRLYVTAGVQYKKGIAGPVFKSHHRTNDRNSWVSFFFDANVRILGLSLDFVEIHLWWLLTYRARHRAQSAATANVIKYFCRGGDGSDEPKLALLRTLDVEVCPIGDASMEWPEYYAQAIRALAKDAA